MKKQKHDIKMDEFFKAVADMCKVYNEKHKDDPIVEVSGQFKFAERTRIIHINPKA
jgi:hypothetical protein